MLVNAKLYEVLFEMNKEFINKINFLINDEYEAIDGYDESIKLFESLENEEIKNTIIKQLEHIREEEEEHIKELTELKKMLLKPSYKPNIDTLKEEKNKAPKVVETYMYKGPIRQFGRIVAWDWEGTTKAISEKQALNNLRFQAGAYLGLDVGSHRVKIELDPDNLIKTSNEEEDYFNEDDFKSTKVCDKCGIPLTDGDYCPKCDDGEEDY